jgi:hypothetical protein
MRSSRIDVDKYLHFKSLSTFMHIRLSIWEPEQKKVTKKIQALDKSGLAD